jgi:hypothetical protein
MAVFGDRVLRCTDGHLFVSSESQRLLGSIHLGWWRMMQCPVDGRFRMCGNVPETSLTPEQLEELKRYRQSPGPSAAAASVPVVAPSDEEGHRVMALSKLKELLDAGAVTREEFDTEKRRILEGR